MRVPFFNECVCLFCVFSGGGWRPKALARACLHTCMRPPPPPSEGSTDPPSFTIVTRMGGLGGLGEWASGEWMSGGWASGGWLPGGHRPQAGPIRSYAYSAPRVIHCHVMHGLPWLCMVPLVELVRCFAATTTIMLLSHQGPLPTAGSPSPWVTRGAVPRKAGPCLSSATSLGLHRDGGGGCRVASGVAEVKLEC